MAVLVKIGNSQGIRIPKAFIEQAQLENSELELKVLDEGLLIQPISKARAGWKKEFDKALADSQKNKTDQEWLDAKLSLDEDWEW